MTGRKRTPEDEARVAEMWRLYQTGLSCRAVGEVVGISGACVEEMLKRRGHKLRPSPRALSRRLFKSVKYRGLRFSPEKSGYLRCTASRNGKRSGDLLHRLVWRDHHGEIPAGKCVSFKDGDRTNCSIENLELIDRCQLQSAKGAGNNGHSKGLAPRGYPAKSCPVCGVKMIPHDYESPSAFFKRRFYTHACSRRWMKGKPRTTRAAVVSWRTLATPRISKAQAAIAVYRRDGGGQ